VNTPLESDGARITRRKLRHLDVCADQGLPIEDPRGAGFENIRFIHECLPESDADEIDTRCEFLGYTCRLPILISCMTGGTGDGSPFNVLLARLAQSWGIPIGLGSMRILFHDDGALPDFSIRRYAPDVPILANIGAAQLVPLGVGRIMEMARRLEVDALVVHLNPGQEIVQPGGDRYYRGIMDAIGKLVDLGELPVIVKETGHGIRPRRVRELLGQGVAWVDLAGAGGTDWLQVEACRAQGLGPEESLTATVAETCVSWGLPTALILGALAAGSGVMSERGLPVWLKTREARPVIASGGIKSGLDVARALALGAGLVGMARPFVLAHASGKEAGLERLILETAESLKAAMFLAGAKNCAALRQRRLMVDGGFLAAVGQLAALED